MNVANQNHKVESARRTGRTLALIVIGAGLISGCKSSSKNKEEPKQEGGGRGEMVVSVQGADAEQEGQTLRLDYPVLLDKNDRIPDWVINPGLGGVTGAVGVAAKKGLGTREQVDEARLSARIELVSMLETRIQAIGREELEENSMARPDLTEDSRKNVLGIARDILDSVLAGSRQRALWFDPENGECYVWIVLDGKLRDVVDHHVVEGTSVFIANQALTSEYRPERRKIEPPTVIVESPQQPAPAPAPQPVLSPAEELEQNLEPIEVIPSKSDDGEKKGEG